LCAINRFGGILSSTININNLVTSINEISYNDVSIYPNPVKDFLHVKGNIQLIESITITNLSGKTVYKDNGSEVLNLTGISSGIYFIQFKFKGNAGKSVARFIKY
jgi:hypothetical protein